MSHPSALPKVDGEDQSIKAPLSPPWEIVPIPKGHYRMGSRPDPIPSKETALEAVRVLIRWMGDNPERDGLKETPDRVLKSLGEMTRGYSEDPKVILSKTFDEFCDEMVSLRGISFTSLCEHHLLPISGVAHVGYIPGKVVGISKLARLVKCFAKRLQIQERMTRQIATSLMVELAAQGAAVVIEAKHSCMECRGVESPSTMVTSAMLGVFRDKPEARAEFLSLVRSG